jgi:hypothetical protein
MPMDRLSRVAGLVVIRTHGSLVVITIERPEFRTAGKVTAAARQEIAAMASGIEAVYPS